MSRSVTCFGSDGDMSIASSFHHRRGLISSGGGTSSSGIASNSLCSGGGNHHCLLGEQQLFCSPLSFSHRRRMLHHHVDDLLYGDVDEPPLFNRWGRLGPESDLNCMELLSEDLVPSTAMMIASSSSEGFGCGGGVSSSGVQLPFSHHSSSAGGNCNGIGVMLLQSEDDGTAEMDCRLLVEESGGEEFHCGGGARTPTTSSRIRDDDDDQVDDDFYYRPSSGFEETPLFLSMVPHFDSSGVVFNRDSQMQQNYSSIYHKTRLISVLGNHRPIDVPLEADSNSHLTAANNVNSSSTRSSSSNSRRHTHNNSKKIVKNDQELRPGMSSDIHLKKELTYSDTTTPNLSPLLINSSSSWTSTTLVVDSKRDNAVIEPRESLLFSSASSLGTKILPRETPSRHRRRCMVGDKIISEQYVRQPLSFERAEIPGWKSLTSDELNRFADELIDEKRKEEGYLSEDGRRLNGFHLIWNRSCQYFQIRVKEKGQSCASRLRCKSFHIGPHTLEALRDAFKAAVTLRDKLKKSSRNGAGLNSTMLLDNSLGGGVAASEMASNSGDDLMCAIGTVATGGDESGYESSSSTSHHQKYQINDDDNNNHPSKTDIRALHHIPLSTRVISSVEVDSVADRLIVERRKEEGYNPRGKRCRGPGGFLIVKRWRNGRLYFEVRRGFEQCAHVKNSKIAYFPLLQPSISGITVAFQAALRYRNEVIANTNKRWSDGKLHRHLPFSQVEEGNSQMTEQRDYIHDK